MTILLDLSSVIIILAIGNSLIKTSFEAKVIRSLENLKQCLFSGSFGFMFKQFNSTTTAHNFTKNSLLQI